MTKGWNYASKKLPDNSDDVLVYYSNCHNYKNIMLGHLLNGVWWPDSLQRYYKVIAWHKLPKLPEEEIK